MTVNYASNGGYFTHILDDENILDLNGGNGPWFRVR